MNKPVTGNDGPVFVGLQHFSTKPRQKPQPADRRRRAVLSNFDMRIGSAHGGWRYQPQFVQQFPSFGRRRTPTSQDGSASSVVVERSESGRLETFHGRPFAASLFSRSVFSCGGPFPFLPWAAAFSPLACRLPFSAGFLWRSSWRWVLGVAFLLGVTFFTAFFPLSPAPLLRVYTTPVSAASSCGQSLSAVEVELAHLGDCASDRFSVRPVVDRDRPGRPRRRRCRGLKVVESRAAMTLRRCGFTIGDNRDSPPTQIAIRNGPLLEMGPTSGGVQPGALRRDPGSTTPLPRRAASNLP